MKNNNYICHTPCFRNSIAYDHDFWYTCIKWWYLQVFFQFFKILIFRAVRVVKEQKMAQNDKKVCLLHSISEEPYIIWLWFLVHMCKMIIFPVNFFILGFFRGIKGKKWPKITNFSLFCSGTVDHLQVFFVIFFKKIQPCKY